MSGFGIPYNNPFSGGFGQQQPSSNQQSSIGNSGFGNSNAFGSSSSGNPNVTGGGFGAPASSFNNSNTNAFPTATAGGLPFGADQSPAIFGGSAPAGAASGMSFGSSPNVVMSSTNNHPQPNWGTFSQTNSTTGQFSSNFGGGMGSQSIADGATPLANQQPGYQPLAANPFGVSTSNFPNVQSSAQSGPAQSSSTTMFGSSSNVLPVNSANNMRFPSASNAVQNSQDRGSGRSPRNLESAGTAANTAFNNPFASGSSSSVAASGFSNQQMTLDRDVGGAGSNSNSDGYLGFRSSAAFGNASDGRVVAHSSMEDDGFPGTQPPTQQEQDLKSKMEEKKRLQAMIEEKKRKLERQKRMKEESANRSRTPTPPPSNQPRTESLAERNARRFGQQKSRKPPSDHAEDPSDGRPRGYEQSMPSINPVQESEREELEHAVALVGLCRRMCPDDELVRRQSESDIQALEVPLPGTMHPQNWTIRDTAVKRFRRSAADYKLDVPEWVRPPDVLERTCAYLEEWIMERDRQGPDPRFPQGGTPPPLDVYQFVWDRTRMIRKDFILQNYVGTGGLCDARAVRCHERIARWHAMCEHQLSHIPDFVSMQSQQNIQELGQTMKTLNQFYDDSLNRSTVEVPDQTGAETLDTSTFGDYFKGSQTVQGKDPIDYDGSILDNSVNTPTFGGRLIGDKTVSLSGHGTAEPEMRALYILLTMDNEGGMEVLKYAARLFKERSTVYRSYPVQLALAIFKSKKELNYAKFFAYLRSPATPYLFSCIMFKHVELMRKVAFRIMSSTYGARTKDTGETMYDQYPLINLVKLLCFEDLSEAREACKFYNITTKQRQSQSGESLDIIFWKATKFKEPKHPEKGHTLRLQPRKMVRTIERKLCKTTRLAVCRGEVSGEGASLSDTHVPRMRDMNVTSPRHVQGEMPPGVVPQAAASIDPNYQTFDGGSVTQQHAPVVTSEQSDEARAEHERREREAKERLVEEQRRVQKEKEEQERQKRQKAAADEKVRMEQEQKATQARMKAECEKLAKQAARQAARQEEERVAFESARRKEAEKRQREAEEAARKEREQEEQRQREQKEREAHEQHLRILEEKRQKEIEEERRRNEEEMRRRKAEEKRLSDAWNGKVEAARKTLLWAQWKRALSHPLESYVGSRGGLILLEQESHILEQDMSSGLDDHSIVAQRGDTACREVIERMIYKESVPISLSGMVRNEINRFDMKASLGQGDLDFVKSTLLLKVAVICPGMTDVMDESFARLIFQWVGTSVKYGAIDNSFDAVSDPPLEIRCLVVKGSSPEVCASADVCLVVIPPRWADSFDGLPMVGRSFRELVPDNVRRVALLLSDDVHENESLRLLHHCIDTEFSGTNDQLAIVQPSALSTDAFSAALEASFRKCAKLFVRETCVLMTRISPMLLVSDTIVSALRQTGVESDDGLVTHCATVVEVIMEELESQSRNHTTDWKTWPAPEFAVDNDCVPSYFGVAHGLPKEWWKSLTPESIQFHFGPFLSLFRGHLRDVVQRMLLDAPSAIRDDCTSAYTRGNSKLALEKSLLWLQQASSSSDPSFIYLPDGLDDAIMDHVRWKINAMSMERPKRAPPVYEELLLPDQKSPLRLDDDIEEAYTPDDRWEDTDRPRKKRRPTSPLGKLSPRRRSVSPPQEHNVTVPNASDGKTEAEKESDAYTRKLEKLLHGETVDMFVGDVSLSSLLADSVLLDSTLGNV